MKMHLMRDNHTFLRLPSNSEKAFEMIKEEFMGGETYCSIFARYDSGDYILDPIHAFGKNDWENFSSKLIKWLNDVIDMEETRERRHEGHPS